MLFQGEGEAFNVRRIFHLDDFTPRWRTLLT